MMSAGWLAHGGGDAGPVLIMLVPAGLLYGIGLILCLRPVLKEMTRTSMLDEPTEAEKLAAEVLGEDEAKEQVAAARRKRALERKSSRTTEMSGTDSTE